MAVADTQNQQITQSTAQQISEQNIVFPKIEIGFFEILIGIIIGISTIIGAIFVAGKKWGNLTTTINRMDCSLKEMAPDLKDIREKFGAVENKVETLWKDKFAPAHSPRQLNDRGEDILKKSGIKEIVDDKRVFLLDLVKKQGLTNAYDAENSIEKIMFDLPKHCPDVLDKLKDGAFKTGTEFSAILFIGSIYLRNLIFPDLGFLVEDLDKPKG